MARREKESEVEGGEGKEGYIFHVVDVRVLVVICTCR